MKIALPIKLSKSLHFCFIRRGLVITLLAGFSCTSHAASDFFLNDYVALPEGSTTLQTYYVHRAQSGRYTNGSETQPYGGMESNIGALRISHFTQVNGITLAPFVLLAGAQSDASPTPFAKAYGSEASGFADIRLGGTLWLVNQPDRNEYLGVSVVVTAPSGDYQPKQVINVGENRWKFTLNGGWLKPITEQIVIGLSPEVTWYGSNDRYAGKNLAGSSLLEQAPAFGLTGVLAYRAAPKLWIHIDAQTNRGGSQELNHVAQNNPANNNRLMLGVAYGDAFSQLWSLRYSRDISIENGFRITNEVMLRYSIAFQ